jgi:hypothetical protein
MPAAYYTLVGSLPHLPHFERAERLPISRLKLEQRLKMLEPEDAEALDRAEVLAAWQLNLQKPRTDAAMAARYREAMEAVPQPALRDYLEFRLGLQTLVAALRRRQAGLPVPARGEDWGVGPLADSVRAHWNDPDFRLAATHRWLPEARRLLEAADAKNLERLLMDVLWTRLAQIAEGNPFGFEAVFSFVFRWDILHTWLARDPAAARTRFQALINEVTHGR